MSAVGVQAGEEPGEFTVIDLGCGTAILAVAALKLGASRALGVDIDAEAIQAAQENAQANGVSDRLELGLGSLAEIQAGEYSLKQADLVLANILAPVLVSLLDAGLSETVATGGSLVLSGILEDQCTDVEVALGRNGLALVERKQIQDWVALRATRRPGHPPLTEPDRS
jgi:ribosomal protein L11 methyltransferase